MRLAAFILALYTAFLLVLTLVLFPGDHPGPNLVPFQSIAHDWQTGGRDFVVNFLGNVVAFIPFGVLIPLTRRRPTSWWVVLLVCVALSAAIEAMQFASGRRVADVDDVLLNGIGGLVGYGILRAWRRRLRPG